MQVRSGKCPMVKIRGWLRSSKHNGRTGRSFNVYAIDYCGIAAIAARAIIDNNVGDIVVLIKSLAEDAYLPHGRVDLLVSEGMGYFLLCENMLGHVRNTWLKDDGIMLPSGSSLFLANFESRRDMGGLNYTTLANMHSYQARIELCMPEAVVSTSDRILELDLKHDRLNDSTFSSEFMMAMNNDTKVAGIVGWFDMEMAERLKFSTSPYGSSNTLELDTVLLLG